MKYLLILFLLSGCATPFELAEIPTEFLQPCHPIETVAQLADGLTYAASINEYGELISTYGECARLHDGLINAVKIAGKK